MYQEWARKRLIHERKQRRCIQVPVKFHVGDFLKVDNLKSPMHNAVGRVREIYFLYEFEKQGKRCSIYEENLTQGNCIILQRVVFLWIIFFSEKMAVSSFL
jgi:hypothetical protein